MADPVSDADLPFAELLGRLLLLLAERPERAAEVRRVGDLLASRVERQEVLIEAGIENSWAVDGDPLKERLQARSVESIQIAPGAGVADLLALGRALADDAAPIPEASRIRVQLLPQSRPLVGSGPRELLPDPAATPMPRARTGDQLTPMVEGILRELEGAIARQQWFSVLHDAQAALRFLPSLREDVRRSFTLALRRLLTGAVVDALIEQAYRIPEEQARTAEVLRLGGNPAAERILEIIRHSDTIGPRAFLVEAIAGMPEAFTLVVPLLRSARLSDLRLGAQLIGRLGAAEALKDLAPLVDHPDERTRLAAIDALAGFRDKSVLEPLRRALASPSAATRVRAGQALAARGSGAIAMPLLAAIESEKDHAVRDELLAALARIPAPEAVAALTRIALEKPGRFSIGKGHLRLQLAIVRALVVANTAAARQALERIAAEGDGEVKRAAAENVRSEQ